MNTLVNTDNISSEISFIQSKETKMRPTITSQSARKEAVRRIIEGGERVADIAREYKVSNSTVHNWVRSYKKLLENELASQELKETKEQIEDEKISLLEENKLLKSQMELLRDLLRDAMKGR